MSFRKQQKSKVNKENNNHKSENLDSPMICSAEIREDYELFEQIDENSLRYKSPNNFEMTIPVELYDEIPFYLHPIPTSCNSIPYYYRNKSSLKIKYLQDIVVRINCKEDQEIEIEMVANWLTPQQKDELTNEIQEEYKNNDYSTLFYVVYTTLKLIHIDELDVSNYTEDTREILFERECSIILHNHEEKQKEYFSHEFIMCPICYADIPPNEMFINSLCGHEICCYDCLNGQLKVHVNSGKTLKCLEEGCDQIVDINAIKDVCDEEIARKYENQLVIISVKNDNHEFIHCPFCGVHSFKIKNKYLQKPTPIKCPKCERTFCSKCLLNNHNGECVDSFTEEDYHSENYLNSLKNELRMISLKRCPRCKCRTDKYKGCNHMHCNCGAYWCYQCEKEIDEGYSHYGEGKPCESHVKVEIEIDFSLLEEIWEREDCFPYYCTFCEKLFRVEENDLCIICPECKRRKCRHCGTGGVNKFHVEKVLEMKRFEWMKVPEDYVNWKTEDTTL